jgi:hypothetical protein
VLIVGGFALWSAGALTREKIGKYVAIARGAEPLPPPPAELEAAMQAKYEEALRREEMLRGREAHMAVREADLRRREEELAARAEAQESDRRAFDETRRQFDEWSRRTLDEAAAARLREIVERIASIGNARRAAEILLLEYDAERIAQVLLTADERRAQRLIEAMHRIVDDLRTAEAAGGAVPPERAGWPQKFAQVLRKIESGVPLPAATPSAAGVGR